MTPTEEKVKVLVVDDDEAIRQLFKDILELAGFNIILAKDGEEGLARAEVESPSLIMLDLLMPKMGGIEMLKKLRQTPWGTNIPVVILTNVGIEDDIQKEITEYRASFYLSKTTVDPQVVIEKINSILVR